MKTLVLGMGNPLLTDDAIGVRLARAIGPQVRDLPGVDVVEECPAWGLDLLDVVRGYDRVIVLDAIAVADAVPGRWHHVDAEVLADTVHLANVHDVNFATAIALGRRVGLPLPERGNIHVFGVETEDCMTFSDRMTPALERALPECAAAILPRVRALLATSAPETPCGGLTRCAHS